MPNEENDRIGREITNSINYLVSQKIAKLFQQYKYEKVVTKYLVENNWAVAKEITETVIEDLEVNQPRYMAGFPPESNERKKLEYYIKKQTDKILQARIESHKRRKKFKNDVKKIEDRVKKDYPHFTKEEREKIIEEESENLKKYWQENYQLTEEDVKLLDKEKIKKEAEKKIKEKKKERKKEKAAPGTPEYGKLSRWEQERRRLEWYEKKIADLNKKLSKGKITKENYKTEKKAFKRQAFGTEFEFLDEIKKLEDKLNNGKINESQFEKQREKLEKQYRFKGPFKRPRAYARRYAARTAGRITQKFGEAVWDGFILACFVGIGAVVSGTFGSTMFFLAFLSWGLFWILPNPERLKVPEELDHKLKENPLTWGMFWSWEYQASRDSVWGYLRSLAKISTVTFFLLALWNNINIPFVSIVTIIVAFVGYYSLHINYDPRRPYQLWESLLRFGGLGAFFIPWIIFYGLFDSLVLSLIAMAFFAIPPLPSERKDSELFVMYDFYDKIFFGIIMIAVLIGFFAGWQVPKSMTYTFVYFWAITGIAGFFSPAHSRPAMGFIMLGAASVMYGLGPGQQEVMSALFGPWWPTIQNTFESVTKPIADAFSGFGDTFRNALMLLTNPVGYATQLMNGTHASNPLGKTGAYGVDIETAEGFTISPIFPEQQFLITTTVKNNGAFDARNLSLSISMGPGAPKYEKGPLRPAEWAKPMNISALGFSEEESQCDEDPVETGTCAHSFKDDNEYKNLTVQSIWQTSFTSSGVPCEEIIRYELREKFLPINATITYDYESDSRVEVEFITQEEWDRLAPANKLNQRFIQSEYSSAPVKFPIGTPGLPNPILTSQSFHIGLNLESDQKNGMILNVSRIEFYYPADFEPDEDSPPVCIPAIFDINKEERTIVWNNIGTGNRYVYCKFEPLEKTIGKDKINWPTKTYIVTAHAEYRFSSWEVKSTKVEMGGFCCHEDDCLKNQICCPETLGKMRGMCIPEDMKCETSKGPEISDVKIAPYLSREKAVNITWTTDIPSTSQVVYGYRRDPVYDIPLYDLYTTKDTDLRKDHLVQIENIPSNKTYHYRIFSWDSAGTPVTHDFEFNVENWCTDANVISDPDKRKEKCEDISNYLAPLRDGHRCHIDSEDGLCYDDYRQKK